MVKDHSGGEKGNPLPPHRQGFFYMHHPTDRIAHTTVFVTPVVEHWLEREIAQWVHSMKDRSDDPSHHERTLLPRSYISLLYHLQKQCSVVAERERESMDTLYAEVIRIHAMKALYIFMTNVLYNMLVLSVRNLFTKVHFQFRSGPELSQLDQLLPIGPRAQFYSKLFGNLDRLKFFPLGPRTS